MATAHYTKPGRRSSVGQDRGALLMRQEQYMLVKSVHDMADRGKKG